MSLFQCEKCGCRENTALCNYWANDCQPICSSCDPKIGKWHNRFEQLFLPKGRFKTNSVGNLAHKETGDTDVMKFAIKEAL